MKAPSLRPRDERGMTLIELIISLLVYGVVVAGAIGFLAAQNTAFHRGLDRMTSLQSARYALQSLETDLVTLGTNVAPSQPSLVYGGSDVLAFNADYASNVEGDVFASYVDLGAPNGQVTAARPSLTIPNSSFVYPDSLYRTSAGTASPAELLIFFFADDTTTTRSDDFVLLRQVNDGAPEVVTRHVLRSGYGPFFRYFKRQDFSSAASRIDSIPDGGLPVRHWHPIHGSAADTGSSALADSVRAVRVTFQTTNGLEGEHERTTDVSRVLTFPNAGFGTFSTCGDEPMLGTALAATPADQGGGEWVVTLSWSPATDETMGEQDVARYVLYRQEGVITADWGDPYLSIPPGAPSYSYTDASVESGQLYRYALAAQDCTPSLSSLAASPLVVIP